VKHRIALINLLLLALFLAVVPTAMASTKWYVDGVNGNDNNDCKSPQTACKTIGHAISLAHSGDSIMVAVATYTENLTIAFSLKLIGADAKTTIIDGGHNSSVVMISNANAHVTLSKLTIRNGSTYGIFNSGLRGTLTINNSTVSGNRGSGFYGVGGGIFNLKTGTLTINNSTVSGNTANVGGGIWGSATLQNSIVANNGSGGNCDGSMTSNGYNLSSDGTCNFNGTGDLNNTDPKLGQLGNYGGPTQTIPLLSGSPAIDAGNPGGCTDGEGHLLKTDQRGRPRPDKEDTGGCDMGAYERQTD
jgi:hypothetical protein